MRAGGMRSHRRAVVHRKGALQVSFARYPMSAVRQMQGAQAGGGAGERADTRCAAASMLTRKDVAGETGFIPLPRLLAPSCAALLLRSSGQAGLAALVCSCAPFCQLGAC